MWRSGNQLSEKYFIRSNTIKFLISIQSAEKYAEFVISMAFIWFAYFPNEIITLCVLHDVWIVSFSSACEIPNGCYIKDLYIWLNRTKFGITSTISNHLHFSFSSFQLIHTSTVNIVNSERPWGLIHSYRLITLAAL